MSRLARWLFLQRMKIGREQARSIARAEIENRGFPWVEPVKVFRNYGNWSVVTGLDRRTIQRLRNRHFEPRPGTEKDSHPCGGRLGTTAALGTASHGPTKRRAGVSGVAEPFWMSIGIQLARQGAQRLLSQLQCHLKV